MRICVISDTHLGMGEALDRPLVSALASADLILHAGDISSLGALRQFQAMRPFHAVCGNMDPYPLDELLPSRTIVEADGLRIGLIHGGGSPFDIEARVVDAFRDDALDLIVFGHTHRPTLRDVGGRLLVNPGSASSRSFPEPGTFATIETLPGSRPRVEIHTF